MQYWINHNGVQSGPVDLDALKQMGLTSAAYVWHEGLSDWVKITQLPELQGLYEMADAVAGVNQAEPMATGQPIGEPAPAAPVENNPVAPVEQPQAPAGQPYQQQPYQAQQPQYAGPQLEVAEPCPPTNLVWAIISTLLCCLPAGIVAIVYAMKVTNKYREGDIEGAKRASETGAWWCIASIVLGIICQPIVSALPVWLASMR